MFKPCIENPAFLNNLSIAELISRAQAGCTQSIYQIGLIVVSNQSINNIEYHESLNNYPGSTFPSFTEAIQAVRWDWATEKDSGAYYSIPHDPIERKAYLFGNFISENDKDNPNKD